MSKSEVAQIRPKSIGTSIPRREDPGLLTGRARYIADIVLPDMLHVAILRSPVAHGRIRHIDTAAAQAMPGVELIWTGQDSHARCPGIASTLEQKGFVATVQPLLAHDEICFVGEGIAVVVAHSRAQAEDALERIEADIEELPVVTDAVAAIDADDLANAAVPANMVYHSNRVTDPVEDAFANAALSVQGCFHTPRVNAAPMETRGFVARHEWTSGTLTCWSATQMPSFIKTMTAIFLQFPEHNLEVITPAVGGGFGQKAHLHPEELLTCLLSIELGRPVSWIEDRQENLFRAPQAKQQINDMALAVDDQGRFLALRDRVITDSGAYNSLPWTPLVEGHAGILVVTDPYKIAALSAQSLSVTTNKCPIGAYRGVGFTAPTLAREVLIDRAARKLGLSPFEIRRRNVIRQEDLPYQTRAGMTIREGTFLETVDRLEAMVGYEDFRKRQQEALKEGRLLGLGISIFSEVSGIGTRALNFLDYPLTSHDTATVRVEPTGKVTVTTGIVSSGQGHPTTLAQIAADAFGVPVEDVTILAGSTHHAVGFGTVASRSAVFGAGTIGRAAEMVRGRMRAVAARLLQAAPDDIEMSGGMIHVRDDPGRTMPFAAVAGAAYFAEATHPDDFDPALEATAAFDPSDIVLANGGHAVIVEIDMETCMARVEKMYAVEDCGRMINPMIVEGQIRGGMAQGVGMILLEELVHDERGQLITSTFQDYLLPTSLDIPDIEISHLETPSSLVPGGIKGMGESAMISTPAAVAGAVNDALACLGAAIEQFPASPQRIFEALSKAGVIERANNSTV
ncbi:xanthine dehydrogenase family protein molybdopterin-binding subunit [Sphingobium sp. SJ10-10]|uniref:xanthine dehydrogenase family protein molybdopterin-binding subunit n=1 Tax=Sphingobium sp. SJ10-10 TaxID=3114999 RepID=UPI002E179C08|nr:xanthine dehydrogenase family protein molybdopterin-binding subunit [Sphingobium sp. SJ10-10]